MAGRRHPTQTLCVWLTPDDVTGEFHRKSKKGNEGWQTVVSIQQSDIVAHTYVQYPRRRAASGYARKIATVQSNPFHSSLVQSSPVNVRLP